MKKCTICSRDYKRMNSAIAECSHIDCPYRRNAWSECPSTDELFRGPWPKNEDKDPAPLDKINLEFNPFTDEK